MSNSLTTRTTLGLIPLYVGILLQHYYYKLVEGKGKAHFTVPLRREELMYDEAFTITRVSHGIILTPKLTLLTETPEFHGHSNEVFSSTILYHYINSDLGFWHVCDGVLVIRSKKCRNSRRSIRPSLPPHMLCGCLCHFRPAQTRRACSLMCLGVKQKRRGSWGACGGGKSVPTTKGAFLSWVTVLGVGFR
jgi:hypothetical protein